MCTVSEPSGRTTWSWFGTMPHEESRWYWRYPWLRSAGRRFGMAATLLMIICIALAVWTQQWWPVVAYAVGVVILWAITRILLARRHAGRASPPP